MLQLTLLLGQGYRWAARHSHDTEIDLHQRCGETPPSCGRGVHCSSEETAQIDAFTKLRACTSSSGTLENIAVCSASQ